MSLYQKVAVAVTACLCMLDGFDVLAITFAAPAIKAAWGASQGQIGLVLASSLMGMAAGSLLIAPAADLIGRRRMIFLSLVMMVLGDLWSANTHGIHALMLSRVFTGLGIGTMIAVINSLTAEYASARRRDLCLTIMAVGFPAGGMLGGLLAATVLPTYGWPAVFIAGASFGLIMLVVAWAFVMEPIAAIIARPNAVALDRVNAYLRRCGMPAIMELPAPPLDARSAPFKALFAPGMAGGTMLLTGIYFLHVVTLFFVQSWMPSLIVGEGFAPGRAALIALWVNVGGIIGALLLGMNSMRFGLKPLVVAALSCGAVVTANFGLIPPNFTLLALDSAVMGFFLQSGMAGLYAVVARTFPAHIRVSGTGLVIGIGRVGSAVGPAMAGLLLTVGLSRSGVAMVMAVPSLAAALLLLGFRVHAPDRP